MLTGKRIVNRIEMVGQPDGATVWNVTNKIPLFDAAGAVVGTAGITRKLDTPGRDDRAGRPSSGRCWPTCGIITTSPITNRQLARLVHMSVRAFERKFRATFHLTPAEVPAEAADPDGEPGPGLHRASRWRRSRSVAASPIRATSRENSAAISAGPPGSIASTTPGMRRCRSCSKSAADRARARRGPGRYSCRSVGPKRHGAGLRWEPTHDETHRVLLDGWRADRLARDDRAADDGTRPTGFVSLFNGKDLTGWKVPEGDNGHWKVVDGVIDYDAGSEAKGDKALWSEREYGDFVLQLDWRLKEAPFINKNIPYILPDGTHAKDIHGKELKLALPDADSGVYLRGDGFYQVNIWCWPIGSGEMYSVRMDRKTPPDLRAAVTPRTQADKPVGEWNHFEITVKGKTVKVELNGITVDPRGHHPRPARPRPDRPPAPRRRRTRQGEWTGPPSLVQFKNI